VTRDVERIEKQPRMATRRRWLRPSKRAQQRAELEREELDAARLVVFERARGRCEAMVGPQCRRVGSQAHHKLPRSQGGTHDPENLLWVCGGPGGCHQAIHENPNMAYARGLLLRRGVL